MLNILLVEDHKDIAEVIFDYFENSEYDLDYAVSGVHGLQLAETQEFDCVILDIDLPQMNGFEVCEQLRNKGNNVPILMLTAFDTDKDQLRGFKVGADDYLLKPFKLELLEARMSALVRRGKRQNSSSVVSLGDLKVDISNKRVLRNGKELSLYPAGFKLLKCLVDAYPNLVQKDDLEEVVWCGDKPDKDILRKHIYNLRSVLDKPFEYEMLQTIPKIGYKLSIKDNASKIYHPTN